ncbi:MAG: hypothetical protein CL847_06790 [Crocinitomicaceae bacterium]|nr:hypothetical protein [Crocinitomicaceae bacterium]|tara:strand:- start:80 stop:1762 length:1683 start_codon:yes stop_codon:yes gene_type:complete
MKKLAFIYLLIISPLVQGQITIDGFFEDWSLDASIVTYNDSNFDSNGTELEEISVTNDHNYLYIRVKLDTEVDLVDEDGLSSLRIFLDTDNDSNTGYPTSNIIGSEYGIDFINRQIYNDVNYPEFDMMSLYELGVIGMPTITSDEFEIMISRELLDDEVTILVEEHLSGDVIPNQGSTFTYEFHSNYLEHSDIDIAKAEDVDIRLLAYNLQHNLFDNEEAFARIINALDPDIISFSEVSEVSHSQMLGYFEDYIEYPTWYAMKNGDVMAVSKFPFSQGWNVTNKIGASLVNLPDDDYEMDFLTLYAHPPCCGNNAGRQFHFDSFINFILDIQEEGGVGQIALNTPFTFAGDMNLVGYNEQYHTIVDGVISDVEEFGLGGSPDWDGSSLSDAVCRITTHISAHTWRTNTFNPAVGEYPPGRLDFIFYSNSVMSLEKSFTLDTEELSNDILSLYGLEFYDTFNTSDHLPIVSDFILQQENLVDDVLGCTYDSASNYNASSTIDDGSCQFEDCNYEIAFNAGYEQGIIDGVDLDECPGDFNGDLSVTTQDLLEFLTLFGFQCE